MRDALPRGAGGACLPLTVTGSKGAPALLFAAFSLVFGISMIVATPPLRAPDEAAHFLRAYGIAGGEIVPGTTDQRGRKGLYLPAGFHHDFAFFARAQADFGNGSFGYGEVFDRFWRPGMEATKPAADEPPVFVHYEGSEGYTPAPYLPHAAGAALARLLGLDFLATFYLMRVCGLLFMTGVAAGAIATADRLRWAFVVIALLPSALYGRSVISADGGALAYTMMITTLCLNAARRPGIGQTGARSFWMTLAILSKPPHIVFAALEPMAHRFRALSGRWRVLAAVVAPGVVLLALWLLVVSGEMAAWRMIEAMDLPPEKFDPVRKAALLIDQPLHFPDLLQATIAQSYGKLWQQLIGVLGWLDTPLRTAAYVLLSLLALPLLSDRLDVDPGARRRIAGYAGLITLGYVLCVYLVFYLTWTPIDAGRIWGVQGRYFVVVLPVVALLSAALIDVRLPQRLALPVAAVFGLIAGAASLEALIRTNF